MEMGSMVVRIGEDLPYYKFSVHESDDLGDPVY